MFVLYLIIFIVVSLAVTYVFLVMPRSADAADMDLQSTDYAYGGLSSKKLPQCSPSAILKAKEEGYGIAVTVQMTRDNKPVVFNGSDLYLLLGVKNRIGRLTLAQLSVLRFGATGESVLTLKELLSIVDGQVPLLLEIRPEPRCMSLCNRLARIMDTYNGAFAVQSVDPRVLAFFKKYRPRFARGQIVCKRYPTSMGKLTAFARRHMLTNAVSRPDFITVDGSLMNEPAVILATKVFRSKCFIRRVRSYEQYEVCHMRGLFTIFEGIRPK